MSRKTVLEAHGFASPTEAARAHGVSTQTIYNHIDRFGSLDQVHLDRAPVAVGHAVVMPDGSEVGSKAMAARILGCSEHTIAWHLKRHGHLRLVKAAVRLPDLGVAEKYPQSACDAAATPGSTPPFRRRVAGDVDVEAVIETIRQCRDQYREEAA